jgi:hypothetical protein
VILSPLFKWIEQNESIVVCYFAGLEALVRPGGKEGKKAEKTQAVPVLEAGCRQGNSTRPVCSNFSAISLEGSGLLK